MVTVALSAAAVLGYVGYRLLVAESPPPQPAPSDASEPASAPTLADTLPELSVPNLAGEPTPIGSWPGRPLLVNFWATWCAPCLREIPLLKEFQIDHPDVQIVGIAVDKTDAVASFAPEMAFNYPILVGQNEGVAAATALGVQVLALPITVFTAGDGAILRIHTGEVHAEHLENYAAVLADLASGRTDRATARSRLAGLQ
jgi:thiol-disulfide isomerase/thioredoxin